MTAATTHGTHTVSSLSLLSLYSLDTVSPLKVTPALTKIKQAKSQFHPSIISCHMRIKKTLSDSIFHV